MCQTGNLGMDFFIPFLFPYFEIFDYHDTILMMIVVILHLIFLFNCFKSFRWLLASTWSLSASWFVDYDDYDYILFQCESRQLRPHECDIICLKRELTQFLHNLAFQISRVQWPFEIWFSTSLDRSYR